MTTRHHTCFHVGGLHLIIPQQGGAEHAVIASPAYFSFQAQKLVSFWSWSSWRSGTKGKGRIKVRCIVLRPCYCTAEYTKYQLACGNGAKIQKALSCHFPLSLAVINV